MSAGVPAVARRGLHAFAVATALGAYLLIVAGGLAERTAGVHRAAAAAVGMLTVALALWLRGLPRLARLGWLAVALVGAQAGLGALGAWLPLPAAVAALHTGVSLVVFVTVFYLAAQTADGAERRPELAPAARRLALVAAVAALAQAILGAAIRTAGPMALGPLAPLHRLGAAAVAVLVFASAIRTFRAAEGRPWLRTLALAAPGLAAGQILLGVRSVAAVVDAARVQAHLAVGAALLASVWAVYLLSAPARVSVAAPGLRATVRALAQLTKPRITAMVVITFVGALFLAPSAGGAGNVWLALAGTVLIVAAANCLNMYLERDVDGLMARTRRRPLPEGRLSPEAAVGFGAALACAAVPLLLIGGNPLTALLGVTAFVSYVWAYTPLKRRSPMALYVGAIPGALPPLMGWTCATGRLDVGGLVLFGVLFVWQVPHFLAIALYRAEEYARAGIRVHPLAIGAAATRTRMIVSTVALVGVSLLLVPLGVAGRLYLIAAAALGAAFLARTVVGAGPADRSWARAVFLASLVYLTLLFLALGLDRQVG